MVYCVAPNCSSDSTKVLKVDGVGYYNFPRDKKARKVWVRRMHRPSSWVPSLGARVCSKHFVAGDYLLDPAICRAIGFDPKKRLLKPGAFPTLFSHGEGDAMDGTPTTSAPWSAVQKRAHQQAVAEAVAGYNVLYGEEAEEAAEQDDGFLMADEGRFEEVGNHLIEDAVLPQSLDDLEVLPQEHPETFAIGTQVGSSVSMRFAKAVQVNIVTGSRNKGSQTTSCTGDIGCQAEPEVREIAIQTDLFDIDVPVFQGLKPSDEDMEDEEVHFPSQETMKTDDSDDEDWEPCEDDYCQEFDDSLLDDENVSGKHYDFDNEYEQPSPQYERKFIVFESSLRLLFMFCQVCRAPCRVALRTLGTAVMVMAICENQHQQEWTSQPFKGQLPIGNLLFVELFHTSTSSKAHKELTLILTQKILLKDIRKVSPGVQTSSLESYHKIVGYFAPKSRHFFYEPMKARLLLATLHFNENSNRKQRMGQDEQPQWSISYPKGRGGAAVAKEVKIESTYDYVQLILEDLLKRRDDLPSYKLARDAKDKYQVTHPIPGPVCSKYDKQDKMKVVEETKRGLTNCRVHS
ncbi:uncharacterized protein LOC135503427 [Lineus longissimus]|uniref:uncharacterized protein LOC135503427 n=1 Tax=Lineus longissimus TaxID=88925 RepID=UPI00315C5BE4